MSNITYSAPTHGNASYRSAALGGFKALQENLTESAQINILHESGISDLIGNEVLFSEFKSNLLEGLEDESQRTALGQLVENTRVVMMQESMITGTNPITALSLPMLRVGWPKIAVREGLPTEAVEKPSFKVTVKRPFITGKDGVKRYLPEALMGDDAFDHSLPRLERTEIVATNGAITMYDMLAPVNKNASLGDEVDPKFHVTEVRVTFPTAGEVTRSVSLQLDVNTNTFNGTVTEGDEVATIIGNVIRSSGILNVAAIGATLEGVKIEGFISSEANNAATQVGFDIQGIDCVIGTGQPVESPINIQQMTDVMNMYKIDATLSHIETMTTFLAQITDLEGVRFIDQTYDRIPAADRVVEYFDVVAPSNFALGDTAWREELKHKLDRVVSQLQTHANYYNGHTVIFCHPLDAQVISNVKWVYAATEQVNDVAVDYKVGTFVSGTTSYVVLQSPHFSQGKLRCVFVPADEEHKTLVYYPYAFHTIRGAISSNSNAANLPNIQMIKRHLFKAFTPLVGVVEIKNNGIKRAP